MKKLLIAFLPWLFTAFGYKALAQEETVKTKEKDKKETQEIVIRRKGDKDAKITVEIKGDKVTVNGKPLSEFKDDDIAVQNRTMTVHDGMLFDLKNDMDFDFNFDGEEMRGAIAPMMGKRTFLGVTTEKSDDGAKVTEITNESAASKAGLQKDDIITKIDDKKIDGPETLSEVITSKKPKDNVKITFKRNGKVQTATATLQERTGSRTWSYSLPNGTYKTFTLPKTPTPGIPRVQEWNQVEGAPYAFAESYRRPKLGLKIQDTDESDGVKVLDVEENSVAASAGLKKDDVITEIGGEKVANTDEAREQLQENRDKTSYMIKAKRNGSSMSFTVKIPKKLKTANL